MIDGYTIQIDRSGVGAAWRDADEYECPANIIEEIEGEILDGKSGQIVASNGLHYRWSPDEPTKACDGCRVRVPAHTLDADTGLCEGCVEANREQAADNAAYLADRGV